VFTDLEPRGPATVRAEVAGDPDRRRDRVVVRPEGMSVRGYRDVPFAARDLRGTVVVEGDEVRFEEVSGTALGVPILGRGRILGITSGPAEPDVVVEAIGLPLGTPLRSALGPVADRARVFWDRLAPEDAPAGDPTGGTRADAVVTLRPSTDETPLDVRLRRIRGPLHPQGLGLDLADGELHYDGREATLRLDATLGDADVSLDRAHYDVRTGRLDIQGDFVGLRFPEDVRSLFSEETTASIASAFPERVIDATALRLSYDPGPERMDLAGELEIRALRPSAPPPPGLAPAGTVEVHRLTFWFPPGLPTTFDASVRAAGFDLKPGLPVEGLKGVVALAGRIDEDGVDLAAQTRGARLRVATLPVTDADVDVRTGPSGPTVELRSGSLHGGRLTARVAPGGTRVAYHGEVHLRNADLSRFGGQGNEVQGQFSGDALFRNPSGEEEDLRGSIELTVKDGDLVRFPLVSAILNLIPGAGKLTDAILSGSLEGRVLKVRDIVVRGPILSLTDGRGTVGFDGALDLTLNPGLPLTTVVVTGTVGKPDASLRLLSTGK
jgi:hypothetical protein